MTLELKFETEETEYVSEDCIEVTQSLQVVVITDSKMKKMSREAWVCFCTVFYLLNGAKCDPDWW